MPETTGQRVQLPSDGKQRTEAKAKTEKQEIVGDGWQTESASLESHAGIKHDMNKKGECKDKT